MKKCIILTLSLLLCGIGVSAQTQVTWSYSVVERHGDEATLRIRAEIGPECLIYSTTVPEGGPIPTRISFLPSTQFELVGGIKESQPTVIYSDLFRMRLAYFNQEATFEQKIRLRSRHAVVHGTIAYMIETDSLCVLPDDEVFNVDLRKSSHPAQQ
ncbi:hypothetical protein [Mucilaginibacter terrae]|uniref:Uncharacterized protein n=1 Tax=Mucilaginibacter terrae TaxID=1955052 RepID=A0ABU3GRD4_9SPHI|nr:hypothetical protein [Mucilaginibacter terrae]MDT3402345.1 hypothetical protein [Mucilaginibacter terrae]